MKETRIKPNSRQAMKYRGIECLNCGHPLDLTDRFCAYCGQLNTTKRLTLKDFANEFILSVFTYDSRFRFTIKDILFKPGTITRNYVDGKRLKYANPFRFFLSASIFYFILLALLSLFEEPANVNFDNGGFTVNDGKKDVVNLQEELQDIDLSGVKNYNISDDLEEEIITETDSIINKSNIQIEAGTAKFTIKNDPEEVKDFTFKSEASFNKDEPLLINRLVSKSIYFYEFYDSSDILIASQALDSLKFEKTRTNLFLYSKANDYERIKKNPLKFIRFLASKTPFFLFFFAPIFALFFWLIYSKRKFNYMEHLIFIFHIFSWIFVVLIICLIPDTLLPSDNLLAAIIILLIGPFYFYKALRNFYKQKRRWTILKFVFLNIVFYVGATFFALIFFVITAFLF